MVWDDRGSFLRARAGRVGCRAYTREVEAVGLKDALSPVKTW